MILYLFFLIKNKFDIETRPLNVSTTSSSSYQFGIDTVFNCGMNSSNIPLFNNYSCTNGSVLIYASFCDPFGVPLVCDDDSVLEAWWNFELDKT